MEFFSDSKSSDSKWQPPKHLSPLFSSFNEKNCLSLNMAGMNLLFKKRERGKSVIHFVLVFLLSLNFRLKIKGLKLSNKIYQIFAIILNL